MSIKNITCIGCPLGCGIAVEMDGGKVTKVSGNSCKKGESFAISEAADPRRILTTTMRTVSGGLVPVKTDRPVKKGMLFGMMKAINGTAAKEPVNIGDVLIRDILGSGADVVASGRPHKSQPQ
jgi:CxxC motif-containing protein